MEELINDEEDQSVRKALNEAKKKELEEKFGAFFPGNESDIPPDIESQWLNHIEEFELKSRQAKSVKIREFIGNPSFSLLGEIPADRLEAELDRMLDYLSEHSISVEAVAEVSDAELYRFITTELLEHEIEDIRIEGMQHCFIYEEFHPNAEYDAKMFAKLFLGDLFDRSEKDALRGLAEDELYDRNGKRVTKAEMTATLRGFYDRYPLLTGYTDTVTGCSVEGDYATVKYDLEWTGLRSGSMESVTHKGTSTIRLKKSPYDGFDVIQFEIPGFDEG